LASASNLARVEEVERPEGCALLDPQVAGEVVAGPRGHHRQQAAALGGDAGERRDRAVAPARDHAVAARERRASDARAVVGVRRDVDGDVASLQRGAEVGEESSCPPATCGRVHDGGPSHGGGS
jgi:hypothetical protein